MKNLNALALISIVLISIYTANVQGDEHSTKPCLPYSVKLSDLNLQQPPRRVLLVPLLSGELDSKQNPRWPEQPARLLEAFYRNRFNVSVH